jgi:hypothetical protein
LMPAASRPAPRNSTSWPPMAGSAQPPGA